MKILKRATQKNVALDTWYYTTEQLERMLSNHEIVIFTEYEEHKDDWTKWQRYELKPYERIKDLNLRLFLSDMKEIKVICKMDGMYTTVCIGNNGEIYYVNLNG